MPKLLDNLYTAYEFSEEESYNAFIFTDLQFKAIQTELAAWANRKANLAYKPDEPDAINRFINENEYHRGAMEAIGFMLSRSEDTKTQLYESIKNNQQYGLANQKGQQS